MGRFIEGQVNYYNNTDKVRTEFGREKFSVSVHDNGHRTLRVVCEFDQARVLRDVVYTVDDKFKPLEAYIRVVNKGEVGSGWFRFTDTHAESEAMVPEKGRINQRIDISERVKAFGSHPICSDFMRLSQLKRSGVGEPQYLTNCMNCSPIGEGYGEEGPMLNTQDYNYVYRGQENVTVQGGTFECHKYDWMLMSGETLHFWTIDKDFLPIQVKGPESNTGYELVSLSIIKN